jgi:hypothetical protein
MPAQPANPSQVCKPACETWVYVHVCVGAVSRVEPMLAKVFEAFFVFFNLVTLGSCVYYARVKQVRHPSHVSQPPSSSSVIVCCAAQEDTSDMAQTLFGLVFNFVVLSVAQLVVLIRYLRGMSGMSLIGLVCSIRVTMSGMQHLPLTTTVVVRVLFSVPQPCLFRFVALGRANDSWT